MRARAAEAARPRLPCRVGQILPATTPCVYTMHATVSLQPKSSSNARLRHILLLFLLRSGPPAPPRGTPCAPAAHPRGPGAGQPRACERNPFLYTAGVADVPMAMSPMGPAASRLEEGQDGWPLWRPGGGGDGGARMVEHAPVIRKYDGGTGGGDGVGCGGTCGQGWGVGRHDVAGAGAARRGGWSRRRPLARGRGEPRRHPRGRLRPAAQAAPAALARPLTRPPCPRSASGGRRSPP